MVSRFIRPLCVRPQQTLNHVVNVCPFTKFGGEAGDNSIRWLEFTEVTALANGNELMMMTTMM